MSHCEKRGKNVKAMFRSGMMGWIPPGEKRMWGG
jgi:hypothetical protein